MGQVILPTRLVAEVPGLVPNFFVHISTLSEYVLAEVLLVRQACLDTDHVISISLYITKCYVQFFNLIKKINV